MTVMQSIPQPPAMIVRDALRAARQVTGLDPARFGHGAGILLRRGVTAGYVTDMESGAYAAPADYLLAAAQLATTPVSVLLGELDDGEGILDRLEARIAALTEEDPLSA